MEAKVFPTREVDKDSKITLKTNIWINYSYKVANWNFEANAKNLIDLVNYLNPNVAFSYLVV